MRRGEPGVTLRFALTFGLATGRPGLVISPATGRPGLPSAEETGDGSLSPCQTFRPMPVDLNVFVMR